MSRSLKEALVEHLTEFLKEMSSLIKTGMEERPESFWSSVVMDPLRPEHIQYRDTSVKNETLDKIVSNIKNSRERVLGVAALY